MENEIVLFESEDDQVKLNVEFDGETVWLTKEQMAALFGRDRSVISRHISNIFREGEFAMCIICTLQIRTSRSRSTTSTLSSRSVISCTVLGVQIWLPLSISLYTHAREPG